MKPPVPIRAAVEKMRAYNPPLEGRTKKLRLDFNENPIGCSPKVRQALAKLSSAEICSYPEQETVRSQMAKHFGVRPDELLLTNGTDEALHVIVSTFVEPGDGVLLVEPTYAMYRFYSELAGARILAPRYTAEMQFPWPEVLALLGGAKSFPPDNPSSQESFSGAPPLRRSRVGSSADIGEGPAVDLFSPFRGSELQLRQKSVLESGALAPEERIASAGAQPSGVSKLSFPNSASRLALKRRIPRADVIPNPAAFSADGGEGPAVRRSAPHGNRSESSDPSSSFRGSELQLRQQSNLDSGALAPEERIAGAPPLRSSRVGSSPPRVFFLPNPNSPTGNLLSLPEIRRLLIAAKQTMVVIDEAYFEFSGVTVIPWIRRYANLIVTRTFSKTAGLAGLRLGCIFVNRELAAIIRKSQSPYPVNAAALVAAEAAMRDRAFIARTVREVKAGRQQLERGLTRLGIRYFPSGGNFILVHFGKRAKQVVAALDRKGILVRDRSSDFAGEGYVRITVGTPAQTTRLLRALKAL